MIQEMIDRIKAEAPLFKLVGAAAEFQAAAERNPVATPACYVIALEERPGPNQLGNQILQKVDVALGIVIVVRNVSDTNGGAASITLDALRRQAKAAIYGWSPAPELDPFERGASNLLVFQDGHVWWQDVYLTSYLDRSV